MLIWRLLLGMTKATKHILDGVLKPVNGEPSWLENGKPVVSMTPRQKSQSTEKSESVSQGWTGTNLGFHVLRRQDG